MAVYVLAAILTVGIPFLLYCLWNFSRELKSRNAGTFFSTFPTVSSVQPIPPARVNRQNASSSPETRVVHRPDRDYPVTARVS
jgi:hypothetical protein